MSSKVQWRFNIMFNRISIENILVYNILTHRRIADMLTATPEVHFHGCLATIWQCRKTKKWSHCWLVRKHIEGYPHTNTTLILSLYTHLPYAITARTCGPSEYSTSSLLLTHPSHSAKLASGKFPLFWQTWRGKRINWSFTNTLLVKNPNPSREFAHVHPWSMCIYDNSCFRKVRPCQGSKTKAEQRSLHLRMQNIGQSAWRECTC